MKYALLVLLMTVSAASAQQEQAYYGPFSPQHQEEKEREQRAIALRVGEQLKAASDRDEVRYAENRRRCQAALQVAELCGKYAGTFYCDDKGFKPVVADTSVKPVALDNRARYTMEHCVLDAARRP